MFIFFCCRFIEKLLNCKDLTDYLHLYDVQPVLHHPRIQVSHNDHDIGGKNECVNEACCRNFPRGSEKDINSHTTNPNPISMTGARLHSQRDTCAVSHKLTAALEGASPRWHPSGPKERPRCQQN